MLFVQPKAPVNELYVIGFDAESPVRVIYPGLVNENCPVELL